MKLLFYIFATSACFCDVGCVSDVALSQNNPEITGSNLPFEKESIHEIRLTYWVKVREPGTYNGVVDSGIRKRILTITDSWTIQDNIEVFNVLEMMLDSNKSPLIGEVVLVEKDGDTWKMDFLKSNLLRISSGHLLKLDKSAFFICLLANGMSAEKEFRDPELPLYNPLEWVALKREHAQKLPGLNYNPICDGLSEDFVFNLYHGDPTKLEDKTSK